MSWLSTVFRRKDEAVAAPSREALDTRLREAFDRISQGRFAEGEQLFRDLLEDDPHNADARYFLAVMAIGGARSLEAIDHCQKGIESRPNDPELWFQLSVAYYLQGLRIEAVEAARAAVELNPEYAQARNNLGVALVDEGFFDDGRELLEKLLATGHETAQLQSNLGIVYRDHGRIDDAIAAARRAIELAPDDKAFYTNYLFTLNYKEGYGAPLLFDAHRSYGARFAKPYVDPPIDRSWPRRLRVGYVSPDFRNHVVACFVEPILAHHDRSRVEVFCYYIHRTEDNVTERLRAQVEHWVEAAHMSDAEMAQRVRDDRIDILVDLAGHTGDNRLLVFAEKPAPVQMSYLGYPGTTGVSAIDYRISDARADPPGEADRFSAERLLRPWPTYFCYRMPGSGPDPGPLPARAAGHVTFGCFGNFPKLSNAFLDAAAQVLEAVPGSRLKLKSRTLAIPHVAEVFRDRFRRAGIDVGRVDLVGWEKSFDGHLSVYRSLDIVLDSFPYSGATTTCEALWMGVPVVTFSGDRHAGRMASSIVGAVGLEDLIAADVAGYVRKAVALAGDLDRLEKLRSGMRERMRSSPLTDEAGFVRALEQCYEDVWLETLKPKPSAQPSQDELGALLQRIAVLRADGKKIEAEEACKEVLKIQPDNADALSALWDLSYETRNHGVAVEWLRRGIAANDRIPRLHYMMGYSLMEQGNMAGAAVSFRSVLALDPSHAKAWNNLGCALEAVGDFAGAIDCYRKAIELDPALGDALYNLGNAHRQQGLLDQAIEYIRRALQLQSARVDWKCNLGDLLCLKLELDEAARCYEEALAIDPQDARAHQGLGWVLQQLGRAAEAEPHLRRAMALKPDDAAIHSQVLLCLHYVRGDEGLREEHEAWAARHARGAGRQIARAPHELRPQRRLNVGYLSPDFKRHSVAGFIEPLLAGHDRGRFKTFCYSNVAYPDPQTLRFSEMCEEWRDIARMPDEWVSDRMRADRIDILVDLAGHTGEGRLRVFARKPAPVQVTWLGYPNTTGLAAMDYRFTDAIADPPGSTERFHVEKLVRLERGFLCYAPPAQSPEVAGPPSLAAGHVTFGCFNNLAKLTPGMIARWSELLKALPGSRLKLKSFGLAAESARRRLREQFAACGVDPDRLELRGPDDSFEGHLAQYGAVDVALDVFPYNGAATTCEALWMGVPVISLAGPTHVSRVGASILNSAGLGELVADSGENYVQKALELARDPGRLGRLRSTMRARLRGAPLLDAAGFVRSVERAYGEMWDRWVEKEEAAQAAASLPTMSWFKKQAP